MFRYFPGAHSGVYSCPIVIKIAVEGKKKNIKDDCIKDVQLIPSFEMLTFSSRLKSCELQLTNNGPPKICSLGES